MKEKFYITTPVYYVNAKPHIGHAYTTIAADVLARFQKLQGKDVFFLTGTDEHGLKIQKKAEDAGENPQKFVDEISEEFKNLWAKLDIKYDNFIRTTDQQHITAVQKVLKTLHDKGAIYKGEYEGLYCIGCEQFKSENELVNGKCPDHDAVPEKMKEECYLLKMSDIQEKLIEKIENNEFHIAPIRYKHEVLSFLKNQKLNDISISRKNVKWGIELPFDSEHTTYVWVDAFLNYLTGIGWNGDVNSVPAQWPADVQLIGKDILRVHATIWAAILIHLDIKLPKMLFVHGHILSDGKKMSKTLGNAISIEEMIEKFGVDATRYLLLSAGPFGEDIDVTMERMVENYNANLANGLGNLVSRIIKLSENSDVIHKDILKYSIEEIWSTTSLFFKEVRLEQAIHKINKIIQENNKIIDNNKPWELVKSDKFKFEDVMKTLFSNLYLLSEVVTPFMPDTAKKIKKALETKQAEILFPRIK